MMGIATFLKSQLDERNWTQKDLADRAGMQAGSLTYIMKRDHIVPQLETLNALAQALDLPLAQLISACGFEVGRPGDVHLSAEEAGLFVQITEQPDIRQAIKLMLRLPAGYQRLVYAFIVWASKNVAGEKDIETLQVAVPNAEIMGAVYEESLSLPSKVETNHRELQEIRSELDKLRKALKKHLEPERQQES